MESLLHKLLREAGLSPDKIQEVMAAVKHEYGSQIEILVGANLGWQAVCARLEANLRNRFPCGAKSRDQKICDRLHAHIGDDHRTMMVGGAALYWSDDLRDPDAVNAFDEAIEHIKHPMVKA